MFSNKLDFSSCVILIGFYNSSHINGSVLWLSIVFSRYANGNEVNKQFISIMTSLETLKVLNTDVKSVDDYKKRFN